MGNLLFSRSKDKQMTCFYSKSVTLLCCKNVSFHYSNVLSCRSTLTFCARRVKGGEAGAVGTERQRTL